MRCSKFLHSTPHWAHHCLSTSHISHLILTKVWWFPIDTLGAPNPTFCMNSHQSFLSGSCLLRGILGNEMLSMALGLAVVWSCQETSRTAGPPWQARRLWSLHPSCLTVAASLLLQTLTWALLLASARPPTLPTPVPWMQGFSLNSYLLLSLCETSQKGRWLLTSLWIRQAGTFKTHILLPPQKLWGQWQCQCTQKRSDWPQAIPPNSCPSTVVIENVKVNRPLFTVRVPMGLTW